MGVVVQQGGRLGTTQVLPGPTVMVMGRRGRRRMMVVVVLLLRKNSMSKNQRIVPVIGGRSVAQLLRYRLGPLHAQQHSFVRFGASSALLHCVHVCFRVVIIFSIGWVCSYGFKMDDRWNSEWTHIHTPTNDGMRTGNDEKIKKTIESVSCYNSKIEKKNTAHILLAYGIMTMSGKDLHCPHDYRNITLLNKNKTAPHP